MELKSLQTYQVKSGDIKVNARELELYVQMKEGLLPTDDSFREYFVKKYLELPDIRIQEQQAYEYLQKAKELVKTPEDKKVLSTIEQEYLQTRSKRMELSEKLKQEQKKYTIEGRLTSMSEPRQEINRQKQKSTVQKAAIYRGMGR